MTGFYRRTNISISLQKPAAVIRSFVRREGRFTPGQQAAVKEYWPVYGVKVEDKLLDLQNIFANEQSIVLDIGFGNGEALISLARQHPQLNFLGAEVYRPGIGSLLRKVAESEFSNVRVVNMDAVTLLREHIAQKCFASVLIWFPDPWPKRRHYKRRLIQTEFVQLVATKLASDGELNIATDWQPYAKHIQETLQRSDLFEKVNASNLIKQRPQTRFERRGEKLGHQVFAQVYKKTS